MATRLTLERLSRLFAAHRGATLCVVGIAMLVPLVPLAVQDYRLFLSYGPSGLPFNVKGWLISNALRLLSREQLSTSVYDDLTLPFADQPGFLPGHFPPRRATPRPRIGPHPAPQRQLDQVPDRAMRDALIARFEQIARGAQARGLVEVRPSLFERQHSALFVSKDRPWHSVAQQTRGEISHVHAGLDGSIHVSLHPADCKRVIAKGWGERHALDGVELLKKMMGASLPVNYLLIYAPRDDAEMEVAVAMIKASIGFMTGTRDALEELSGR